MTTTKPLEFAFCAVAGQAECPLFRVLPAELRARVFDLCLTDCENTVKQYEKNSLWNRPGHFAPHITHTDILRTCKRCYQEAWFIPWGNVARNIYLVAPDRRPKDALNPFALEAQLKSLADSHGEVSIKHVYVFAQLYLLEETKPLQDVLDIPHFLPTTITITIRHTDFWFWENDEPLKIHQGWMRKCRFPDSLVELRLDLESLERKKPQLDYLASQAAQNWLFERKDGRLLFSSVESIINTTWIGRSTLNNERWIRDEVRPNELDYCISTIVFRLSDSSTASGSIPDLLHYLNVPDYLHHSIESEQPSINSRLLSDIGVPESASAEEALQIMRARESGTRRNRRLHDQDSNSDSTGDETSEYSDDSEPSDESEDDADDDQPEIFYGNGWVSSMTTVNNEGVDLHRFGSASTGYAGLWLKRLNRQQAATRH